MNDPNKRIDVNLSSLLSLKAELLRKHAEVDKAKSSHCISDFVPKRKSAKAEEAAEAARNKNSTKVVESAEDLEILNRSKRILEQKSKFYDRMCATGGNLNSEETSLVMFNQKKQTVGDYVPSSSDDSGDDYDRHNDDDDDEDWVEYTDVLGRTRKCLKKDVEFFKKKDIHLAEVVVQRNEGQIEPPPRPDSRFSEPPPNWIVDTKGDPSAIPILPNNVEKDDETLSMISNPSKVDEMRLNWEKQEAENVNKEFIHYQNVLYDEARNHGVGYYAFSTNDDQRHKQHKDLESARNQTLDAQRLREEQHKKRQAIVQERVRAAQNRQRARLGLPPLTDEEVAVPEPTAREIAKEEKKKTKLANKLMKQKIAEDRRETERKQHMRPWDKGKDKVGSKDFKRHGNDSSSDDDEEAWSYKPEKEPMSQQQWNELKRSERNTDFAPPPTSSHSVSSSYERKSFVPPTSTSFNRVPHKPFVVRNTANYVYEETTHDAESERRGAQFAPPSVYDDSELSFRPKKPKTDQLENSIAAGLRFLREQSDKSEIGPTKNKSKWTTKSDY